MNMSDSREQHEWIDSDSLMELTTEHDDRCPPAKVNNRASTHIGSRRQASWQGHYGPPSSAMQKWDHYRQFSAFIGWLSTDATLTRQARQELTSRSCMPRPLRFGSRDWNCGHQVRQSKRWATRNRYGNHEAYRI